MAVDEVVRSLWLPTTTNRKTGNIPTSYIGQSLEHVLRSCREAECALLDTKRCYAWFGTPRAAYTAMAERLRRGYCYDLSSALENALRSARYVRVGALGDPCALPQEELPQTYDLVMAMGFRGVLAYTHGWRVRGAHLRGIALASCDSLVNADVAVHAGWRATVILPYDTTATELQTPAGRTVLVCPAQARRGVNCNMCGLCDARARGPPVIGFIDHGPQARAKKRNGVQTSDVR